MKYVTIVYASALVVFATLVSVGVARPYLKFAARVPHFDKIGHFVLMGILSLLVNLSLRAVWWRFGPIRVLKGSLIITIIVVLEEVAQIWIPMRQFSFTDLASDLAGIFVFGQLAAFWVSHSTASDRRAATAARLRRD